MQRHLCSIEDLPTAPLPTMSTFIWISMSSTLMMKEFSCPVVRTGNTQPNATTATHSRANPGSDCYVSGRECATLMQLTQPKNEAAGLCTLSRSETRHCLPTPHQVCRASC